MSGKGPGKSSTIAAQGQVCYLMASTAVHSMLVLALPLWELALHAAPTSWIWADSQNIEPPHIWSLLHLSTATRIGPFVALLTSSRNAQATTQQQLSWGLGMWALANLVVTFGSTPQRVFSWPAVICQVAQYAVLVLMTVGGGGGARLLMGTGLAVQHVMAKSQTWWGLVFTTLSVLGPIVGLLCLCFPQTTFQPAMYRDPSSIITHVMQCVGCNLLFSHSVLLLLKLADHQHQLHFSICKLFTLVTIFIGAYEMICFSKSSARFEALRELCMTAVMVAYLANHTHCR